MIARTPRTLQQNKLKENLGYNPDTGKFIRLISNNKRVRVGDVAGGIDKKGYEVIHVDGKQYLAHRLAWFYVYGVWPNQIDHANHIRNDNRWSNLSEVTIQENNKNISMRIDNTSGVMGVNWDKASEKWKAQINSQGKQINLGRFTKKDDAIKARELALIKYEYHANHGVNP